MWFWLRSVCCSARGESRVLRGRSRGPAGSARHRGGRDHAAWNEGRRSRWSSPAMQVPPGCLATCLAALTRLATCPSEEISWSRPVTLQAVQLRSYRSLSLRLCRPWVRKASPQCRPKVVYVSLLVVVSCLTVLCSGCCCSPPADCATLIARGCAGQHDPARPSCSKLVSSGGPGVACTDGFPRHLSCLGCSGAQARSDRRGTSLERELLGLTPDDLVQLSASVRRCPPVPYVCFGCDCSM